MMKFTEIHLETLKRLFNENKVDMVSMSFGDEFEGYGYNWIAELRIFNDEGESKVIELDKDQHRQFDLLEDWDAEIHLKSLTSKEFDELIEKMNKSFMGKMRKGLLFDYHREGYESDVYTLSTEIITKESWKKIFQMVK